MSTEQRELGNPFAFFLIQAAIDQQRAAEEAAAAERQNQQQIAEMKRQDRKGYLTREKDEGEDLERNYNERLRDAEKHLDLLKEERQYGVTEEWQENMAAAKKALADLKTARDAWTTRKQALYDELRSLGGDTMQTTYINHTIQAGEDLAILAKKYLGDPFKWGDIWAANPSIKVVKNAQGVPIAYVKPGDIVRVPITKPATTTTPVPTTNTPSSVPTDANKEVSKPNGDNSSKRQSGGGGTIILWASVLAAGLGLAAVASANQKPKPKRKSRK